jgi:hypothetical protein
LKEGTARDVEELRCHAPIQRSRTGAVKGAAWAGTRSQPRMNADGRGWRGGRETTDPPQPGGAATRGGGEGKPRMDTDGHGSGGSSGRGYSCPPRASDRLRVAVRRGAERGGEAGQPRMDADQRGCRQGRASSGLKRCGTRAGSAHRPCHGHVDRQRPRRGKPRAART